MPARLHDMGVRFFVDDEVQGATRNLPSPNQSGFGIATTARR
jgi:hypothetical protein